MHPSSILYQTHPTLDTTRHAAVNAAPATRPPLREVLVYSIQEVGELRALAVNANTIASMLGAPETRIFDPVPSGPVGGSFTQDSTVHEIAVALQNDLADVRRTLGDVLARLRDL